MAYRFTIVEADEDTLFLTENALTESFPGCRISAFHNAEDALAHISIAGTDLVISDQGMPRMPGTEMVRRLRLAGQFIPVILISGHPEVRKEALDVGATRFLVKQGTFTELIQHVRNLLPY